MIVRMADSVTPLLIPRKYAKNPNGVAAYQDGPHAWDALEYSEYPNHWRITVTGAISTARKARVIDVENYDATPADVAPYQAERAKYRSKTTVYCSRDTIPQVIGLDDKWEDLLWWIAILENRHYTREDVQKSVADLTGCNLALSSIMAAQLYDYGDYDGSIVYGNPEWSHND